MNFKTRMLIKIEKFTRKNLFYTPYYDRELGPGSAQPEIFNKYGERMNVFFLADREFAYQPYGNVSNRYILWDRYNFGLKTHFYTHDEAFNTAGNPDRKFAMMPESRAIFPKNYEKFIRNKKYIENEFEALFTYDDEILETFSNAKFLPFCANFWYKNSDENVTPPTKTNGKQKAKIFLFSPQIKICAKCIKSEKI